MKRLKTRQGKNESSAGGGIARTSRTVVMTLMLLLAVSVGVGLDRFLIETGLVGASTQLTNNDKFVILEQTYDAIRNNYVLEEEISDEELIYGAASGMVDALGDEGHSTFLDPEEARAFEQSSRGELIGIGIQIDTEGDLPVVVAPIPNSPAYEAGIKPGDTILEVDGTDLEGLDPNDAGDMIRGEEGTDVTLVLQHAGETETYEVTITRAKIRVEPVSWAMLPNGVMWLQVSEFSSGATEGVQQAVREAEDLGATSIVLDLRNNPGGLVFEAIGIASQFLPDGTPVYQEQDADGRTKTVKTVGSNGVWQEGPLVVLINENSASSSEIVSSSISDAGRAELIGEKTFGTGTVLLPFELEDGSMALLGIELWLTASGEQIYKKGVEPDQEVLLEDDVFPALPIEYVSDDTERAISDEQWAAFEDIQLITAHEEAQKLVADGQ
jgi:carboxyl-terminal processing protease